MKKLLDEKLTLEAPALFVDLYGLNPANFPKWIPGMRNVKGKFGKLTVDQLISTRVDVSMEKEGLLVDVAIGKDEHKILLKKPSIAKGIDIILEEVGEFKIEVNFVVRELEESRSTLEVVATVLDHKRAFHPIFNFELKYFLKKTMNNFAKKCQESFNTLEKEIKTFEAEVLDFYHWNVSQLHTIIDPIEKDLNPEFRAEIKRKFKKLSAENSDKIHALLKEISDVIPEVDKKELAIKVKKDIKHIFATAIDLDLSNHAESLNSIHSAVEKHLETCKFVLPTLLKDISAEKIATLHKEIVDIFQHNVAVILEIVEEIKTHLPPQDIKNMEKALIDLLRKDIEGSRKLVKKLASENHSLDAYEKKIADTLHETLNVYEVSLNKKENSYYLSALEIAEKAMCTLQNELKEISGDITPEKIENLKKKVEVDADSIFKMVGKLLAVTTPEAIASNKDKFHEAVDNLANRYSKAIKLVAPDLDEAKIKEVKEKVLKAIKDEYNTLIKK